MLSLLPLLLTAVSVATLKSPLSVIFPRVTRLPRANTVTDEPLFLTPYIKAGQLEKARNLSKVTDLEGFPGESYSGYLTVDEKYNSNMFFWFFPATENAEEAPVVLWLQGGPGGSSMFGLFVENGPFGVDTNLNLVPRNLSWTNKHNMIYIDNPVGTGFSFTEDDAGFARNEEDVGNNLYEALLQFFTLYNSYQPNDFYITGESYAGKYVPAAAYKIHIENPAASMKINFKGMAIGDGLVDPINQLDYGSVLYAVGLIDAVQRTRFTENAKQTAEYIEQGDFVNAFHTWDIILNGDKTPYPTYYKNCTGFDNYFNYLYPINPYDAVPFDQYLNLPAVRIAIHVGDKPFNNGQAVEDHLLADIMNSSKPMVAAVLDGGYRVMIYNGQLDVIIAYTLTEQWLASVQWRGADAYAEATRHIWRVDNEIAGYVRAVDNLLEVMVRSAGHMLPSDQPTWSYELINMFTSKQLPTWQ